MSVPLRERRREKTKNTVEDNRVCRQEKSVLHQLSNFQLNCAGLASLTTSFGRLLDPDKEKYAYEITMEAISRFSNENERQHSVHTSLIRNI